MKIRSATQADLEVIATIYNQGIRTRQATFDTNERTANDIRVWLENKTHPLLVAEEGGEVLGWVHASSYRTRKCYSGVAEFSIYVADSAKGQGVGDLLMKAFIPACESVSIWKILSRIFPENTASRTLCQRHGFREVGTYKKHAKLEGVWKDVVIVERLIESNLR
jgi:L-amino acid N-acyltransferase YncA